ncbi:MAG TPA: SUMF1/EgtB/PvdO family nonheme iron enzyme [Blastocatellia bacterium]
MRIEDRGHLLGPLLERIEDRGSRIAVHYSIFDLQSSIFNLRSAVLFVSSIFSILVFSQHAFAQNSAGSDAPKQAQPKQAQPKQGQEDKKKPAKSAGSAGSDKVSKPASNRRPSSKTASVRANLTIVAPPGTAVEVDGKRRGVVGGAGELTLPRLAPGDHRLRIFADGYEPWRGIFVMSVASTRFEPPLKKKPQTGRLALTTNEPGTEIIIDETRKFTTERWQVGLIVEAAPGQRQLRAIKPGYKEWSATVVVKPNETAKVNIELKRSFDMEIEMLRVPEGPFICGDNRGAKDQRPQHQVLTSEFEISSSEVTNQLYKLFIDATNHPAPQGLDYGWNGNDYPPEQDGFPVVFVSWEDAVAFCKWLSEQSGNRYRLPTEAEWEKAAKLGGDQYQSAGKVWEWCSDWYDPNYYNLRERINPQGPARGKLYKMMGREGDAKVIRGGGFGFGSVPRRAAERNYFFPKMTRSDIGFRIVREVKK